MTLEQALFLRSTQRKLKCLAARHGSSHDAQDLIDETFLRLRPYHERDWAMPASLAMIRQTFVRLLIDKRRRERWIDRSLISADPATRNFADPAGDPSRLLERKRDQERVRAAMATLQCDLRAAIEAIYFRGVRHSDAASELRIPLETLRTRLKRARKLLRSHLGSVQRQHAHSQTIGRYPS